MLLMLVFAAVFRDKLPYRYETWRLTHGIGGLLIAAMGTHHAIDAGRYSGINPLAIYWLVLLGLAVFTLVYVYVITPFRQLRRPYRVVSVDRVARKTWDLAIEPVHGDALEFEPGQFCWLTLGRSPFAVTEHPFSISSCPADRPVIRFTIKEAGNFTNCIGSVALGARAYLDGPHGGLTLTRHSGTGIAFIAGGVGLAPIMSILRHLHAEGERWPLKLVYGNRLADQILYRDELERMAGSLDLTVHHVLSEPPADWSGDVGQLDKEILRRHVVFEGYERWLYVVCGPAPMIDSVEDSLGRLGVPLRQIVSEKFSYDP